MAVEYHLLNARKILKEPEQQSVLETLKKSVSAVEVFLGEQDIDLVIRSIRGACSEEMPVSGYAPDAHTTYITLDANYANYMDVNWQGHLAKSVAHEFHHNKRWGIVGYGETLGEALVSEGLAQAFEVEMGHKVSPYSINLTKEELFEASERARKVILSEEGYSHANWFFGTEKIQDAKEDFKRWTGYSLGFSIVSKWLLDNEESRQKSGCNTAAKAVDVSAADILKPWLEAGKEYFSPRTSPLRPSAKRDVPAPQSLHRR